LEHKKQRRQETTHQTIEQKEQLGTHIRRRKVPVPQQLKVISLFACWFQPGLISQSIVFSSHNKPAPAGLISPEINQRIGRIYSLGIVVDMAKFISP